MSRLIHDGMVVDTFSSSASIGRGTALFLNGFPGAIGPLPGVLAALERGWEVIFPQYPGTYDSGGEFSPGNASRALAAMLRSPSFTGKLIKAPTIAIAHSFGALILVDLIRQYPQLPIKKVLLLAPVISYQLNPDLGIREELLPHLEGVIKSHPMTYRIGNMTDWKAIAAGLHTIEQAGPWTGLIRAVVGDGDDTYALDIFQRCFSSAVTELLGCSDVSLEIISSAGHAMHELLPTSKSVGDVLG